MSRLGAVILAAGFSSRMGRFKPLLKLGGRTLLDRVVGLFHRVGVSEIVVVCGHRAEETAAAARILGAEPVINPDFANGMFSSVTAGLAALADEEKAAATWILPVDIPLIRPGTLRLMEAAWSEAEPALVHPAFGQAIGHPPLLDGRVWPSVLNHSGEQGLRGALASWQDQSVMVPTGDRNILLDLDTPDKLPLLEDRAARLGRPDPEESDELARKVFRLPDELLDHGRAVASTARRLAEAMPNNGLDLELIQSAGLLHDLAKGQPDHAAAGAARLRELGLGPVAEVIADHPDMAPPRSGRLGEAELICLADKCVQGRRAVDPDERYRAKLDLYRTDPAVEAVINRRWTNCRSLIALWEKATGRNLVAFLNRSEQ